MFSFKISESIFAKISLSAACQRTPASTVIKMSAGESSPSISILSISSCALPDNRFTFIPVSFVNCSTIGSIN